jgi:hypothetical protein
MIRRDHSVWPNKPSRFGDIISAVRIARFSIDAAVAPLEMKPMNNNHNVDSKSNRPRANRLASFAAVAGIALMGSLTACSERSAAAAENQSCAQQAHGTLPWGYYPGFGCGPVPRAQTLFP